MRIPAKYTEVLKNLLDDELIKPLIDRALSTYPMYEPENKTTYTLIPTREELNKKLLNFYKYREIGFETVGRFLDELEITMNEIMPYYYQLYKSADIMNGIEDPFGNVDIKETFEQETKGTAKATSSGSSESSSETNTTSDTSNDMTTNGKNIKSLTPQDLLDVGTKNINSVDYADEANWHEEKSSSEGTAKDKSTNTSENSSSGNSNSESEGTTKHTLTKVGNQGVNTYAHDMNELRTIFLNIEQQIIHDKRVAELFMQIY